MSQTDKKDSLEPHTSNGAAESAEDEGCPSILNERSVMSEKEFTSPKGKHYRIIRTDEMDPYDAPAPPEEQR